MQSPSSFEQGIRKRSESVSQHLLQPQSRLPVRALDLAELEDRRAAPRTGHTAEVLLYLLAAMLQGQTP